MTTVEQTSQRHELYREVNKRIREAAESFAADQPVAYLCECGLTDCSATVEFTRVHVRRASESGRLLRPQG
jgi:ligand-binding sensor protein